MCERERERVCACVSVCVRMKYSTVPADAAVIVNIDRVSDVYRECAPKYSPGPVSVCVCVCV